MNTLSKVWPYLRNYRKQFYLGIFFQILSVTATVVEPFMFGLILTELASNVADMIQGVAGAGINYERILSLLVVYVIRGIIFHSSTFGANFFITESIQYMTYDLRQELIEKINRLPVAYFDNHQIGNILNRLTSDVESISNALQQSLLQVLNAVLTILFVLLMMFAIDWRIAILVSIAVPLSGLAARYIIYKSQPYFSEQANVLGELNGFVQENFSGFEVLKLYNQEKRVYEDFTDITNELYEAGFKASFISGNMRTALVFITHISYMLVVALGGIFVLRGQLTIGNLQAFTQYTWQIANPMQIIAQVTGLIQSAFAAIDRVFEVLDQEEEDQSYSIELEESISGQVSFDNVSFSYQPDQTLVENFDVDVKPGEMIAIVGPTGAGKTTMINLLMRFYDVTGGRITVDGKDIRALKRQHYRSQFGMVLQDTWLFEGSIRENLRFGNLEASDAEIEEAARTMNVHDYIMSLPQGYESIIDQESSNISAGQKQLLTIARALLAEPQILILDEATSSVDTRMERLIQEAMNQLMEGRTSFVIAHRLSTIQNADRILVMRAGQIIEQGSHNELLAAGGLYHELYNSQFEQ